MTKKNNHAVRGDVPAEEKTPDAEPNASPADAQVSPVEEKTAEAADKLDEQPEVQAAADAVARAKAEFEKAQQFYEEVRTEAAEQLKKVRESTVGELVDVGLKFVKKHPGPGVLIAAAVGFFLGRLLGKIRRG